MQISHAILIGSVVIALAIIFDGPITQPIVEGAKKNRVLTEDPLLEYAKGLDRRIEETRRKRPSLSRQALAIQKGKKDPLLEYAKELDRKIEEMRRERPRFSQRKAQ